MPRLVRRLLPGFLLLILFQPFIIFAASPSQAEDRDGSPRRMIALFTDFGDNDFYAPTLKGAIFAVDSRARVVDLTHESPPFDIREAAFLLAESSREFPPGVVFVGIVDPGVGTRRKPIVIRTRDDSFFVGPDNGMLVEAARLRGIREVREIANRAFMRRGARSTTFHGRDIFGPAGASIAKGMPFEKIGPKLEIWVEIARKAPRASKGRASGEVVHVDTYGNLLTNIEEKEMAGAGFKQGDRLRVRVGAHVFVTPFAGTYGDVPAGTRVVTVGSSGRVEIAINEGSLAEALGAGAGEAVVLEPAPPAAATRPSP
jgi:S-adenosylmethionine hydrolase